MHELKIHENLQELRREDEVDDKSSPTAEYATNCQLISKNTLLLDWVPIEKKV